jgi:hypothetical protein
VQQAELRNDFVHDTFPTTKAKLSGIGLKRELGIRIVGKLMEQSLALIG